MADNKQKGILELNLNSIEEVQDDPTLLKCTFGILDFNKSWNGQIVTKEVALNGAKTLLNKPLVLKYFPVQNENDDHLGSHEAYLKTDKDGNEMVATDTIACGVAITEGYIKEVNGEEILCADYVLWRDRFGDICDLLIDWHERGIPIRSSCEYFYSNYEFKDKIEYVKDPIIFSGHCVLNSEARGDSEIVYGAYDSALMITMNEKKQFNELLSKTINQVIKSENNSDLNINKNPQEEVTNVADLKDMFKKMCELSHGDIRNEIYSALSKVMSANEYDRLWISSYGVYDDFFIYETYENDKYIFFKVAYTKTETEVTVDIVNKVQVTRDQIWVEVGQVQEVQTSLNSATEKIAELEGQLNAIVVEKEKLTTSLNEKEETIKTLNSTIENSKVEKETLETKFNEVTEKLTTLNSKVEEMQPLVDEYNSEKFEKALSEKTEMYKSKFISVNAMEKFESDEVKELIKTSLNETEEGKNAVLQLNSMIVDLIQIKEDGNKHSNKVVKELNSKLENLIPSSTSFDDRYSM